MKNSVLKGALAALAVVGVAAVVKKAAQRKRFGFVILKYIIVYLVLEKATLKSFPA